MKYLIIVFVILMHSLNVYSQQFADAFIIEVFDRYVKVISPKRKLKTYSVVLLNKTTSKLFGKFATDDKDLKFTSVGPAKS
jgi:hypothetical protein